MEVTSIQVPYSMDLDSTVVHTVGMKEQNSHTLQRLLVRALSGMGYSIAQ